MGVEPTFKNVIRMELNMYYTLYIFTNNNFAILSCSRHFASRSHFRIRYSANNEDDNPWNIFRLRFLLTVPMRTAITSTILNVTVLI